MSGFVVKIPEGHGRIVDAYELSGILVVITEDEISHVYHDNRLEADGVPMPTLPQDALELRARDR